MDEYNVTPLRDRVKITIWEDFERMKRQGAALISYKSKNKKYFALQLFREKFYKFYVDVVSSKKYKLIKNEKKKLLKFYIQDLNRIKNISDVTKITICCREIIEIMGITKIEYYNDNTPF